MSKKRPVPNRRLEEARVFDAIYRSGVERGAQNESFAAEICIEFLGRGLIEYFWVIPKNSELDHKGIDMVVKGGDGYYFLDIKSSPTGVENHLQRGNTSYPWLADRCCGKEEVEGKLVEIFTQTPSCVVLPEWVQNEIDHLTPNTMVASEQAVTIGKREQQVLGEMKLEADMASRREIENKKRTANIILSLDQDWRSRFEKLERKKICVIKKWDIVFNVINDQWIADIEIEIFDRIFHGVARNVRRKEAVKKAAVTVKRQILG